MSSQSRWLAITSSHGHSIPKFPSSPPWRNTAGYDDLEVLEDFHLTSVYNKIGKTAAQLLHTRDLVLRARAKNDKLVQLNLLQLTVRRAHKELDQFLSENATVATSDYHPHRAQRKRVHFNAQIVETI